MRFAATNSLSGSRGIGLCLIKALTLIFCALAPGVVGADESPDVCTAAQRFATDAAKRMRSGVGADQEFGSYGGVDAVSKPMLNIINYVHSHRVNKNLAPVRIGALTLAKCNNGSFGKLGYADLPEQYDPDYEKTGADSQTAASGDSPAALPGGQQDVNAADADSAGSHINCEMYKRRIKEIDAQMRDGYTTGAGDSMRDERRKYRELIHKHCS
jgi:hypothetical protein